MDTKHIAPLNLTLSEAGEVLEECSSGGYSFHEDPRVVDLESEWHLDRLEALALVMRARQMEAGVTVEGIAEAELIIDREGRVLEPFKITRRQADEYLNWKHRFQVDSISAGKNGRAWVNGRWTLAGIEALCVVIRDHAGTNTLGARQLLDIWAEHENDAEARTEEE